MAESERALSPGLQQFVEAMGLYFEQYQLPRIGGRMLALLQLADKPLSLDDMANQLGVSRASVSTNVRLLVVTALVEQVSLPGDRRDYYRVTSKAWEQILVVKLDGLVALRQIAERGLAALAPEDDAAREHLEDMRAFCDFTYSEILRIMEQWRERPQVDSP